ncbi:MAG TPA: transglycosylase SLT domain-containing protein [Polyangia bacterium]|nr:transglycosylase SLT domain-containing protein [Polyangia bacterium]
MPRLASLLALILLGVSAQPADAAKQKKSKPAPPDLAAPASPAQIEKLGRGWRALVDGDFAAARKQLGAIDLKRLRSRDYALYGLAQAELLSGDPEAARGHFQALTLTGGRFQTVARWRVADCYWAAGKWEPARKAYESVLASANDQVEPAVARFRIAEALEKRKSVNAALAGYRKVFVGEPLHPLAERALERMKALEPSTEITPAERVARAKLLTANRAWQRALDELDLVPADAPPSVRDEADYWIGTTHFKMRRDYELAAKKLLGVWPRLAGDDRKAEALFHGARAESRADRDDEAIQGYRELEAKFPRSRFAAEASFLIGWLDFNRGKYKQAIPSLEELLAKHGSSSFADDGRWYLGFSRWLSGDTEGALGDFVKLASRPGPLGGGKGAYWRGRALEKLKRLDEAKAVWRELVTAHPFSYYATVARVRLADAGVTVGVFGDGPPSRAPPALGEVDPKLDADPVIARVDELLAAGLTVEAGVELRRGENDLMHRYGAPRALPVLFDRYVRGDDFHRPHQLAESFSGGALSLDPQADATVRRWWEQVYPRAYRAFIEKYSPTGDNPPYYLYTIMQKESAYNPHDVSYADAIGLLQMIPPTSRRVSEKIDFPYTDDVLYDPEGNIRFGAWYIGHLLGKFHKQIALGAGSYNAGPRAMRKWLERSGDRPLDEFIELCSYTQTREYMKKVLDIYARYNYLYEKIDYLPDLKVDKSIVDDGIDY